MPGLPERAPGRPIVRLREATLADVPLLDSWQRDPVEAGTYNDFGLARTESYRRSVEDGTIVNASGGLLVVAVDGEPSGTVTWHQVSHGPNSESRAWNIGISLTPTARGRGVGATAQRLLTRGLFATTRVNRVEASTDVTNIAEQRSLEKAGFTREGVLRGAQFRAGAWHDLLLYSRLRDDP